MSQGACLTSAGVYSMAAVAGSRRTMPVVVRHPCSCRSTFGDCSASTVGASARPVAHSHAVGVLVRVSQVPERPLMATQPDP